MSKPAYTYLIEYEIPPLRAIYHCEADDDRTEGELREYVKKVEPLWRIRKITKKPLEQGYYAEL